MICNNKFTDQTTSEYQFYHYEIHKHTYPAKRRNATNNVSKQVGFWRHDLEVPIMHLMIRSGRKSNSQEEKHRLRITQSCEIIECG